MPWPFDCIIGFLAIKEDSYVQFLFFPLHGPWYVEKLEMFFFFFFRSSLPQLVMNTRNKTFQIQLRTEKKILMTHNSIVSSIPSKETFQKCQTNGGSKVPTNQRICIAERDGYMYINCSGLSGFLVSAAAHAVVLRA